MGPLRTCFITLFTGAHLFLLGQDVVHTGTQGRIAFRSDAPLELIDAHSDALAGVINPRTQGVAFSVKINSFEGFNSAVQREHFMENYLEETEFPVATFTGKVIERIRFDDPGTYHIRVKGILNVHGISTERIVPGTLIISDSEIRVAATFTIPLKDHGIQVPKLLSQKIAEEIYVEVDIVLEKGA